MVDHIYLTTSHHSFTLRLQTSPIGSGTEIGAGSMIHEKENETKTGFYFFFTVGFRFFGHCDTVWICLNTIKFGSSVLADWWSHMSSFILADLERIQTRCWTLSPTTRSIPRLNLLSILKFFSRNLSRCFLVRPLWRKGGTVDREGESCRGDHGKCQAAAAGGRCIRNAFGHLQKVYMYHHRYIYIYIVL